jgi:hypothetical protein
LAAGSLCIAIDEQEVETQWIAGEGHHAPELPGADDAYCHFPGVISLGSF